MVPFAGVVRPSAADLQAKGEEAFLPTATFRIFSFESVHLFIYFFAWEPSPSLSSSSGDRTSLCCTWVNRAPNRSMEQRKIIIESVSFFFSPRHLLSGKGRSGEKPVVHFFVVNFLRSCQWASMPRSTAGTILFYKSL